MAVRYDRLDRTTKEPTKALKAVAEPTYMQPRIVHIPPQRSVALNGFRQVPLTLPNVLLNGVAPSLASVQNVRPAVI